MKSTTISDEEILTIKGLVNVKSHVNYVRSIVSRHTWSNDESKNLISSLDKIILKENDQSLYLCVIGEFSSGKSTFINAVIKDDLLKTDILQATTSAATILQYAEEIDVEITLKDNKVKSYKKDGISWWTQFKNFFSSVPKFDKDKKGIIDFIHKVTAVEEIAKTVNQVKIFHPSDVLNSGLVIIDTPGTNVENKRHIQITREVIENISDTAIIIIPADSPLSTTLVGFINACLLDVLHRCVFVITKLDTLRREKERNILVDNIRKRIINTFNIPNPLIYQAAPNLIINEISEVKEDLPISEIDKKNLIEQFLNMELELWKLMQERKVFIQIEHLSRLMTNLFTYLQDELRKKEQIYEERHNALIKNKIPNLNEFIYNEKNRVKTKYRNALINVPEIIENKFSELYEYIINSLHNEIFNAQNVTELRNIVKERPNYYIKIMHESINQFLNQQANIIENEAKNQLREFEFSFRKIYSSLATLGGKISKGKGEIESQNSQSGSLFYEIGNLNNVINDEQSSEGWAIGGGAGAGAVIGTIIFPGIGTVIGGALGGFIGSLFSPSLDELKPKYWNEISPTLNNCIDEEFNLSLNIINDITGQLEYNLEREIDRYFVSYGKLVNEMIKRDEDELSRLKYFRKEIDVDLKELDSRKKDLEKIKQRLKLIN